MTEITSSINSLVRLWKINHSGPGCSVYEFYEWYISQKNTRVYIIKPFIDNKTTIKTYLQLISLKKKKKNSDKAVFKNHFISFDFDLK